MNIKRSFAIILMAALLCMPVWALGEVHNITGHTPPEGLLACNFFVKDGDVITGSSDETICIAIPDEDVINLTIKDLSILNNAMFIADELNGASDCIVNLTFEGTNHLTASTEGARAALTVKAPMNILGGSVTLHGHRGLQVLNDLNILGGDITATQNGAHESSVGIFTTGSLNISSGNVTVSDFRTKDGGTLILPGYSGEIPEGQHHAWVINDNQMKTGDKVDLSGDTNVISVVGYLIDTAPVSAYGTVKGDGVYKPGDTVTLIAIPDQDYYLKSWRVNGEIVSTSEVYTFVATENQQIEAVFEKIPPLPKTGDESSILLWSALVCISLLSMTMLVRKKKEA